MATDQKMIPGNHIVTCHPARQSHTCKKTDTITTADPARTDVNIVTNLVRATGEQKSTGTNALTDQTLNNFKEHVWIKK